MGTYRLLIFNGYSSHVIFDFTEYAKKNNIILLYLPAYFIYRLQPLNITIFGLLLIYYSNLVKENNRYSKVDISKREWLIWIQLTRKKTNIYSNITSV